MKERIGRGESPTANLGELSPYLQAAFRFDDDGRLAAPFELPETPIPPMPPLGWQRAARAALARRTPTRGRRRRRGTRPGS